MSPEDRRSRFALGGAVLCALLLLPVQTPAGAEGPSTTVEPNVPVNVREPLDLIKDFESPSVAINPGDHTNIVVASRNTHPDFNCRAQYSTDGGETWATSALPTPPLGTCWSPAVAFGEGENVYLATQDRPPGGGAQRIIVYASADGGATFGDPVIIPGSDGFQAGITVDTSREPPRIYVAWYGFSAIPSLELRLSYSDDGGETWSEPTTYLDPTDPTTLATARERQQLPTPVVAPDGTLYVVYKDTGACSFQVGFGPAQELPAVCPIRVMRSVDGGESFDGSFLVAPARFDDISVSEAPGIAVAPDGTLLVTWAALTEPPGPEEDIHPDRLCATDYEIFVARSTDRGESWTRTTANTEPCTAPVDQRNPWIDVAPNGRVDVIFYDIRNDPDGVMHDVYSASSGDGGQSFGTNRRVTDRSFDARVMFTQRAGGFPATNFDRNNGLASTDDFALASWGDARNTRPHSPSGDPGTTATDVYSSRLDFSGTATRPVGRITGGDPVGTAVALSEATYSFAETVVVASTERFAEGLVAGPLARGVRGPVLLTGPDALPAEVAAEIDRLGAAEAVVVGGSALVSEVVVGDLEDLGVDVTRIDGGNRYGTGRDVARELDASGETALVVSGETAAPGIAAGAFGAFGRMPVLLVEPDAVPPETREALDREGITRTIVVGGAGVISEAVVDTLEADGRNPVRVAGADAHETAALLAETAIDPASERPVPRNVVYGATATSWEAAVAAAPSVAYRGGVLLLADADDASAAFLDGHRSGIDQVLLIGGCADLLSVGGFEPAPAGTCS